MDRRAGPLLRRPGPVRSAEIVYVGIVILRAGAVDCAPGRRGGVGAAARGSALGRSWCCNGQYPPALSKLIAKRKSFKQLEDFNKEVPPARPRAAPRCVCVCARALPGVCVCVPCARAARATA